MFLTGSTVVRATSNVRKMTRIYSPMIGWVCVWWHCGMNRQMVVLTHQFASAGNCRKPLPATLRIIKYVRKRVNVKKFNRCLLFSGAGDLMWNIYWHHLKMWHHWKEVIILIIHLLNVFFCLVTYIGTGFMIRKTSLKCPWTKFQSQ